VERQNVAEILLFVASPFHYNYWQQLALVDNYSTDEVDKMTELAQTLQTLFFSSLNLWTNKLECLTFTTLFGLV
jgi:hypothetical protein